MKAADRNDRKLVAKYQTGRSAKIDGPEILKCTVISVNTERPERSNEIGRSAEFTKIILTKKIV